MKALRSLMKKVSKGEGGFTLIELLIVIIILGILAAVVAFNVGGFLGAGTEETAKTQMSTLQTAIIAGMADYSKANVTGHALGAVDKSFVLFNDAIDGDIALSKYVQSDIAGTWAWGTDGIITDGTYAGGGKTCTYSSTANVTWTCV